MSEFISAKKSIVKYSDVSMGGVKLRESRLVVQIDGSGWFDYSGIKSAAEALKQGDKPHGIYYIHGNGSTAGKAASDWIEMIQSLREKIDDAELFVSEPGNPQSVIIPGLIELLKNVEDYITANPPTGGDQDG